MQEAAVEGCGGVVTLCGWGGACVVVEEQGGHVVPREVKSSSTKKIKGKFQEKQNVCLCEVKSSSAMQS